MLSIAVIFKSNSTIWSDFQEILILFKSNHILFKVLLSEYHFRALKWPHLLPKWQLNRTILLYEFAYISNSIKRIRRNLSVLAKAEIRRRIWLMCASESIVERSECSAETHHLDSKMLEISSLCLVRSNTARWLAHPVSAPARERRNWGDGCPYARWM